MNETDFTPQEETLIGLLTVHFKGRSLEARIVDVNKLEGGTKSTLRFTLDEAMSSDLERDAIAASPLSPEQLAEEVANDLEPARRISQ